MKLNKILVKNNNSKFPKKIPNYGFTWIAPELRPPEKEIKEFLFKHPEGCINPGDGNGWRFGKKYSGLNLNEENKETSIKEIQKENKRNKKKIIQKINVSKKSWNEKKKIIEELILKEFSLVPETVEFKIMNLKGNKKDEHNPDGTRLLVYVEGMNQQNNYDYKGEFNIGMLFKNIRKFL